MTATHLLVMWKRNTDGGGCADRTDRQEKDLLRHSVIRSRQHAVAML